MENISLQKNCLCIVIPNRTGTPCGASFRKSLEALDADLCIALEKPEISKGRARHTIAAIGALVFSAISFGILSSPQSEQIANVILDECSQGLNWALPAFSRQVQFQEDTLHQRNELEVHTRSARGGPIWASSTGRPLIVPKIFGTSPTKDENQARFLANHMFDGMLLIVDYNWTDNFRRYFLCSWRTTYIQ